MMAEMEKIVVLDNELQAGLIDSILAEAEIPHVMRSYHDSALDGLFQGVKGWGYVEAEPAYRTRIEEIYSRLTQDTELEEDLAR